MTTPLPGALIPVDIVVVVPLHKAELVITSFAQPLSELPDFFDHCYAFLVTEKEIVREVQNLMICYHTER
jgi:hypothetical protein